ncbi:hypothetical protein PR001_g9440 [Phytophthora rubi]|uniref:Uncharacterized protein n=1 Tax=Phytophthora rubi TaxID=129364 RepID=A0A6A3N473_9STRA|nr:hypothetical protein PR001_g9440 [Phytophthora rubi]
MDRVLAAYKAGKDWMLVAAHNGMPPTTARRPVASGRVEPLPRGGTRAKCVRCTPEIKTTLETYVDENCTYTIAQLQKMVSIDFRVNLSAFTISEKLIGFTYILEQVRVESQTCNYEQG